MLRFALTSRHVLESKMDDADREAAKYDPADATPYSGGPAKPKKQVGAGTAGAITNGGNVHNTATATAADTQEADMAVVDELLQETLDG